MTSAQKAQKVEVVAGLNAKFIAPETEAVVVMLNKGVKAKMAEGAEIGELMSDVFHGGESHLTSILYGGSPALVNSGGVPWTAAYVDSIGDPTCDLRSNIAA